MKIILVGKSRMISGPNWMITLHSTTGITPVPVFVFIGVVIYTFGQSRDTRYAVMDAFVLPGPCVINFVL